MWRGGVRERGRRCEDRVQGADEDNETISRVDSVDGERHKGRRVCWAEEGSARAVKKETREVGIVQEWANMRI